LVKSNFFKFGGEKEEKKASERGVGESSRGSYRGRGSGRGGRGSR